MTGPAFRSTAAFTMRRRVSVPVVDRATFVVFSWSSWRFAVPVESVESVVRELPTDEAVLVYGDSSIPLFDFGTAFQVGHVAGGVATARTLMFIVEDTLIGAVVDHVHEVATVDAAVVQPLSDAPDGIWTALAGGNTWPTGARGRFTRGAHDVVVLDIARIVRSVRARQHDESARRQSAS